MALEYTPKGNCDIGQQKIRWRDQQHLPRFSFHRTGPRCPTSVYVHDDDDNDDNNDDDNDDNDEHFHYLIATGFDSQLFHHQGCTI
jgi:hypothetical protein